MIIGDLNINSIRKKFEQLKETVLKYVDILAIAETKLGETFLESLFLMDGFSKPYRLDRTEAVVRRCSLKKVFLEISQNSYLCQSLCFNKVAGLKPVTLLK